MANNGREGELLFSQLMAARGNKIIDVSGNSDYFDKDIDFIITSALGNTSTFEVKYCQKIHYTGNLFLEIVNPRSKQWNGEGWWPHCQADYLVYGDAIARKFYIIPLLALRERVAGMNLTTRSTSDGSIGLILSKSKIEDLIVLELSEYFDFYKKI